MPGQEGKYADVAEVWILGYRLLNAPLVFCFGTREDHGRLANKSSGQHDGTREGGNLKATKAVDHSCRLVGISIPNP